MLHEWKWLLPILKATMDTAGLLVQGHGYVPLHSEPISEKSGHSTFIGLLVAYRKIKRENVNHLKQKRRKKGEKGDFCGDRTGDFWVKKLRATTEL